MARRAPAPEERRRDAERTRAALLDAALDVYAAKGRAGARVSEIAARAGVDKQLITYYFGGKDGLYQALLERWIAAEREFAPPHLPLDELVAAYVVEGSRDPRLGKLLLRVNLDGEADPDEQLPEEIEGMRTRQEAGEIDAEIDPALLLLMLKAAASLSFMFPGAVREATGLDAASEEFTERYAEHMRAIVRRLRP
jgi:AcrR family transcriptional regulator